MAELIIIATIQWTRNYGCYQKLID